MQETGLVPLAGIALMLVLHQSAEGVEHEVLILGQHHTRVL
jgi:hypothetical protein